MYPQLSNDPKLTPTRVLQSHKGQPDREALRADQDRTRDRPVFLKKPQRIEGLFTLYFRLF